MWNILNNFDCTLHVNLLLLSLQWWNLSPLMTSIESGVDGSCSLKNITIYLVSEQVTSEWKVLTEHKLYLQQQVSMYLQVNGKKGNSCIFVLVFIPVGFQNDGLYNDWQQSNISVLFSGLFVDPQLLQILLYPHSNCPCTTQWNTDLLDFRFSFEHYHCDLLWHKQVQFFSLIATNTAAASAVTITKVAYIVILQNLFQLLWAQTSSHLGCCMGLNGRCGR